MGELAGVRIYDALPAQAGTNLRQSQERWTSIRQPGLYQISADATRQQY